jgi:chemotaxis protein MotB
VISYADLLTLLLAFFVVLYASSTQNKLKIEQAALGLVAAFHGPPAAVVNNNSSGRGIMPHEVSQAPHPVAAPAITRPPPPIRPQLSRQMQQRLAIEVLSLAEVEAQLQHLLQPLTAKHEVTMVEQPLTLTIQLDASVLFADGQAQLTPPAVTLLGKVAGSLAQLPLPFTVVVQGYTDNKPIDTAQFPSNWSLSAERAVSVVSLFAAKGVSGPQLSAEGFGEFAPIASNATAAGRAKNRRVILVIHAPDPNGL